MPSQGIFREAVEKRGWRRQRVQSWATTSTGGFALRLISFSRPLTGRAVRGPCPAPRFAVPHALSTSTLI